MLRRYRHSFPKHNFPSGGYIRLTSVPVAGLRTRHGQSQGDSARPSPKRVESVESIKSVCNNHLGELSPLIRALKVVPGRRRPESQTWTPSFHIFFFRLSQLLKREDVSAAALWSLVEQRFPGPSSSIQHRFTKWQKSLLSQLLHRVLDEWATQRISSATVQPLIVLRIYVTHNLIRRVDWVYSLGFLAKTVYQHTNLRQTQPLDGALAREVADAIRLRILCKAWRLFLIGNQRNPSSSRNLAHSYENLWPGLQRRDAQAREVENGEDFAKNFISGIAKQYNISDPDLDRYLAYSAILTMVALYNSLKMLSTHNSGALKEHRGTFSQADLAASGERGSSAPEPNWHLGSGQSAYWTPEIGHLSVGEASILHIIAHAAKNASLNLTLLRITLGQMSLPQTDVQEIARIYQGFKYAVPAILAKFQDFEYDKNVCKVGTLRRYPLKAYLKRAVESKDIAALDHAGAIAESFSGVIKIAPGNALDLVKACLQMDLPRRALHYWNTLAQSGNLGEQAWSIWLDYAVQKGDHVAFETAWSKLHVYRMRHTAKMWRQRLLLLHQNDQPLAAWDHFCTLVRFTGKNRKLVGVHMPRISPSSLHVEMFHLMIQAYLDKAGCQTAAILKAKDTLELLHKQNGLQVTRDTYMLFVQHGLTSNARQSAVEWYVEGHNKNIKFLITDYALLFEHDLVTHGQDERQPLADPFSNIRHCFDAISNTMRLICGQRLLMWSCPQASPLSARIELILRDMPLVDSVDDNLEDPKMREIQTVYVGLIQHLALNFASQPPYAAKTACLRLLLLLWDHCVITGIPASTKMKSTLRSVVYSLHPELQEKLMRGAIFKNYNVVDPVSFRSYRFLRLIGPQWFAQRVKSVSSDTVKSQLTTLLWNGYGSVNDKALINAGITSQEDRRNILTETMKWKKEAVAKRTDTAERKKCCEKQILERETQRKEQAGKLNDMDQPLRLLEEQLASEVQIKEQTLKEPLMKFEMTRAKNEAERRLPFEELPLESSSAPTGCATAVEWPHTRSQPSLPRHGAFRSDIRATRKLPLRDTRSEDTPRSSAASMADEPATVPIGESLPYRFWRRRRRVANAKERDDQLEDGPLRLHGTSPTKRVYKGV